MSISDFHMKAVARHMPACARFLVMLTLFGAFAEALSLYDAVIKAGRQAGMMLTDACCYAGHFSEGR